MRQYYITSKNLDQSSDDDAYLAPDDPIQELKIASYLNGLGSEARLQEYRANNAHHNKINSENTIGLTGTAKANIMKEQNIKPGTQEWFQLWFGRS